MNNDVLSRDEAEKIIRKYVDMIFRVAYQNVKNYHDAQDITQEVCIAFVAKNPNYIDDNKLKNWFITVTLNKCRDLHKSAWHRKTEPLNDEIALREPEAFNVVNELWKLTDKYRTVLYLHYFEDLTVDEIASILHKSRNTVGSWLTRGRKKLKKILIEGGTYND